jgi:hypothetical protein
MGLLNNISGLVAGQGVADTQIHTPVAVNVPQAPTGAPRAIVASTTTGNMPSGYISNCVKAFDVSPDPPRMNEEYTHVSALVNGICPRAFYLAQKFGISGTESIKPGVRMIWAMGRAVEQHIRKAIIATAPEAAYGVWTCDCGKTTMAGTGAEAMLVSCLRFCGSPLCNYREITLKDDERQVAGNPDMPVMYGGRLTVLEIKSINAKGFDEKLADNRPDTDHALQALYYRRMLDRKGIPVSDKAIVLYGLKDYKWGVSPYLEFAVREDDSGYRTGMDQMDALAVSIAEARKANRAPGRLPLCSTHDTKVAKGCAMCSVCFSL